MNHKGRLTTDPDLLPFPQPGLNDGVTKPRGLAVFRRGKLPMKMGMEPDEFLQVGTATSNCYFTLCIISHTDRLTRRGALLSGD